MLKSCSFCGRIHNSNEVCKYKPKKNNRRETTEEDRLRGLNIWKKKRKYINERDNYICQLCIRNLYNTTKKINNDIIQVHHITPIKEDKSLWLDDDNLLCLCFYHHREAELNNIDRYELEKIAIEQNLKLNL